MNHRTSVMESIVVSHTQTQTSKSPAFQYLPLSDMTTQIRLITLLPALLYEDDIRCSLQPIELSQPGAYEALSYCWGTTSTDSAMLLDGRPFKLTDNLDTALRNLRSRNETRCLRVDAICINQKSDEERSAQVQLMTTIYKSAVRVIIWLGKYHEPEDELLEWGMSSWGFDTLVKSTKYSVQDALDLAQELKDEWDNGTGWKEPKVSDLTRFPHRFGRLAVLFKRQWFERLWVIQELAMAREATAMCGQCEAVWETIQGAADAVGAYLMDPDHDPVGKFIFSYLSGSERVGNVSLSRGRHRSNILSVLFGTKDAKATDHRDRLYAIKGLVNVEETDIDIDYSSGVEVVYREWAKKRILRTKSLDIFSLCTTSAPITSFEPRNNRLPSWAPDLRFLAQVDDTVFSLSNGLDLSRDMEYAAARKTKCQSATVDDSGFILSLEGLRIGTIAKTSTSTYGAMPIVSEWLMDALIRWEEEMLDFFDIQPMGNENKSGKHLHRKVLNILSRSNKTSSKHDNSALESRRSEILFSEFLDVLFRGKKLRNEPGYHATLQKRYRVWRGISSIPGDFKPELPENERRDAYLGRLEVRVGLMVIGQDLFFTEENSLGITITCSGAAVGDEIWVLLGGNTPFILRPVGEGFYRLIGPCYVNDYMDGKAISMWRKRKLELNMVKLI